MTRTNIIKGTEFYMFCWTCTVAYDIESSHFVSQRTIERRYASGFSHKNGDIERTIYAEQNEY